MISCEILGWLGFLPFLQDSDLLIEVLDAPLRPLTFQMPARDAHGANPQPDSRRQGNDVGLELHVPDAASV